MHLFVAAGQAALLKLTALKGHQQIIEVMRDAAGEMADGLHLLGLALLAHAQVFSFAFAFGG